MLIVCGTDFSERSRQALAAAGALARHDKQAEIRLVHVLDPSLAALDAATRASIESGVRVGLEAEARWLRERTAAKVGASLLSGVVSDHLLGFAQANEADLLIVASQGHGDSPLWRLGGTSERLARSSPLPILVVRDATPFEAWATGKRPLRVLLAVDWTSSCEAAIGWVKGLREAGACDVVVGHVYRSGSTGEGRQRYGLERQHSMLERDPETERLLARDLVARVGNLGGAGEVSFRPKHGVGRLGDHLLDLAETEQVDLIVVGTHHKRGLRRLESVAGVTLHHGRTAVAIVPRREDDAVESGELPRLQRVLVPTDLSPASNHAISFAYAVLGDRGGEVHLLHVLPDAGEGGDNSEVTAQLRALVPRDAPSSNVVTRTEVVRHRDPSRAICEAAERLAVHAICMASHGRTGFKRAVLGSVTETVMRESHRPVVVVRPLPPS